MADEQKPNTPVVEEPKKDQPEAEQKPSMTLEQALAEIARKDKELSDTRKEAAKYRIEKKDAVIAAEQKAEATLAERLGALEKERDEMRRTNLVLSVAKKYNLPDALAERLKGSTVEELDTDAQALVSFVKVQTPDPQKPPSLSPTAPTSQTTFTLDAIKKMSPAQIIQNQDAVDAVLSSQK
jgi:hypothetical protein